MKVNVMIGESIMTNTRKVIKVERPRPLKSQVTVDESLEAVLSEMDLVSQRFNGNIYDATLLSHLAPLCENLKVFGPQLENVFKDQLDRCYVSLRNGCRDQRVPLTSRYRLLEVIELRAMNWQPNENLIQYYKQKLAQAETEDLTIENYQGIDNAHHYIDPHSPSNTIDTSQPYLGQYPSRYTNHQVPYNTPQEQLRAPLVTTVAAPMLAPGEVVKSSGKFSVPVRPPGKNQFKDEIVIRNADSGKVMGLKGRRVHMIEELSETIISFQRVAPGARERLVQITGVAEENISQAKQLIEETIRRNASPIPDDERSGSFSSSNSFSHNQTYEDVYQGLDRRCSSDEPCFESNIEDYRYTVTHGNDFIRITGTNLDLVRTAKLVLDEFFSKDKKMDLSNGSSFETDSSAVLSSDTSPFSTPRGQNGHDIKSGPEIPKNSVVKVVRQPIIPSSSKETIVSVESNSDSNYDENFKTRRMLFAKTKEEKTQSKESKIVTSTPCTSPSNQPLKNTPIKASDRTNSPQSPPAPITYTRAFLLRCAASPICCKVPEAFAGDAFRSSFIARKELNYVNPEHFLSREFKWSLLRGNSLVDDEDNSNAISVKLLQSN